MSEKPKRRTMKTNDGHKPSGGIRVTVEDLVTGDTEVVEFDNDYLLLCAGSCYADSFQTYANGTHQVTIKGRAA